MMTVVVLMSLTWLVATLFFAFNGQPLFWKNLLLDRRGVLGIADQALADREGTCNMPRIPTGRYPAFSTTLEGVLDANGNAVFAFEAQRDTLFIGMSVVVADAAPASATISMQYCNTKMLVESDVRAWANCCDRKPIFLVGVREDKKLEFQINGGTPAGAFAVSLHGFQGRNCCP